MTPAKTLTTPALAEEPIRPELPAQQYIQQLPSIQNLLLHLEGKRRKPATLQAVEKGLKALALRTDLENTQAVELAIARYIKVNGRPATNNYKSKLCDCYQHYCKFHHIEWEKLTYTPEPTSIQPPSDEKCLIRVPNAQTLFSIQRHACPLCRARNSSRFNPTQTQHARELKKGGMRR